jgi:predicted transcriptional regulator
MVTQTISVRLDAGVKRRLEALAKRSLRSKSFLAAEAIAQYVEAEEWQLGEIQEGLRDLDAGRTVSHEDVSTWMRSWGKARERKPPR